MPRPWLVKSALHDIVSVDAVEPEPLDVVCSVLFQRLALLPASEKLIRLRHHFSQLERPWCDSGPL